MFHPLGTDLRMTTTSPARRRARRGRCVRRSDRPPRSTRVQLASMFLAGVADLLPRPADQPTPRRGIRGGVGLRLLPNRFVHVIDGHLNLVETANHPVRVAPLPAVHGCADPGAASRCAGRGRGGCVPHRPAAHDPARDRSRGPRVVHRRAVAEHARRLLWRRSASPPRRRAVCWYRWRWRWPPGRWGSLSRRARRSSTRRHRSRGSSPRRIGSGLAASGRSSP